MKAVIMAGGKGTRLVSITKDEIPKPMAPVQGKPILYWQVMCLKRNKITDITIIVGHLGEKIVEYFGDGTELGVHINYIEENEPLGTAGALYYLKKYLDKEPFFLIFGDVMFDIDMNRMYNFHKSKNSKATLFVHPNAHPFDSDLVVSDREGHIIKFDSKNNVRNYWYDNCVNAGFYLFDVSVCDLVSKPKKIDLEKELLAGMIKRNEGIFAYSSPEYIKDVGTVERIQKAERDLENGLITTRNLSKPQKAIFIDRDGTINKKNDLVYKEEQFELEESAIEAIRLINNSGYLAIVITNQPVVARGLCEISDIENIHNKMKTLLGQEGVILDEICFCPHHPDKGYPEENALYKIPCNCRKPSIGMIEECVQKFNIDLTSSWFIGDTTVDVKTGKNAGLRTALVLTGDAGKDGKYEEVPDLKCENLLETIKKILEA